MWIIIVLALFPNGTLKGISYNITAQQRYYTAPQCQHAAELFNQIDFAESAAPDIRWRAVCVPSPTKG